MDGIFRFVSNPSVMLTLNCCVGPVVLFVTGLLVGLLAGRGYTVRLERVR